MQTLKNNYCIITYEEDKKAVFGRDKTDHYNDPAFYNTTKRSIKKAWQELTKQFTEETRMRDAMRVLGNNNLKCRSYCMMD